MPEPNTVSSAPVKRGFIREALSEFRRKLNRNKLRKQLKQQEAERLAAFTALGQRAREEKVDLSDYAALRDQIAQTESRAGQLSADIQSQEARKTDLENKRKEEAAKFDSQRRAVEEKKKPVDDALREARKKQKGYERAVKQSETRLLAIEKELSALDQQKTADLSQTEAKRSQLQQEQAQLSSQLPSAKEALREAAVEAGGLDAESQQHAGELGKIDSARKAALGEIDGELKRLRDQLSSTRRESGGAAKEQTTLFLQLGRALYDSKSREPALAEPLQVISEVDRRRATTQAALDASESETRAMPRGTMLKFTSVIVVLPLLLIVGGYFAWSLWSNWQTVREWQALRQQLLEQGPPKVLNPYLTQPLSNHPAYTLADRMANAESEEEVAEALSDLFRTIHLGVYTGMGEQVVAGAERSDKDFFLYDFQRKILARAYHRRNVSSFSLHSMLIGKELLKLENPLEMDMFLRTALPVRYLTAVADSTNPENFLILFVDGLARRQAVPYSLVELPKRFGDEIDIDAVQSFLILLDYFVKPPEARPSGGARMRLLFPWEEKVHAESICDKIAGDDAKGNWGNGLDQATEWTSHVGDVAESAGAPLGGAAGSVASVAGKIGSATGIVGFIGDILILRGLTLKVTATPDWVILSHSKGAAYDREQPAMILKTVAEFQAEISDEVLKCGWLVGKDMPTSGPLKGVELYWTFKPNLGKRLMFHDVEPDFGGRSGSRNTTDENGEATVQLRAAPCPAPDGKVLASEAYKVTVGGRFISAQIPTPGAITPLSAILKFGPGMWEFLTGGKKAYDIFQASWHEKKPYDSQY